MRLTDVQRTLSQIGLRPQPAAGQCFLLDESVAASMVTAAGVNAKDTVLEIGPGLGILTRQLLATGAQVIAVELDQRLATFLKRALAGQKNLTLVNQDIFKVNLPKLLTDGKYKLVANLPYGSTSLIFRNFLSLAPRPSSLTVMIQRDVADRITAEPGKLSTLGVTVQYYCQIENLFTVPPASFYPSPKVTSAVVHGHSLRPINPTEDQALFRIVRAGFAARRKFLANSLASALPLSAADITARLASLGFKPTVRAQEIPVGDWPKIQKILAQPPHQSV